MITALHTLDLCLLRLISKVACQKAVYCVPASGEALGVLLHLQQHFSRTRSQLPDVQESAFVYPSVPHTVQVAGISLCEVVF